MSRTTDHHRNFPHPSPASPPPAAYPDPPRGSSRRAHPARRAALVGSALGWLLMAGAASAGDGAVELSQTCAVQTGCTKDDAPGFPITLHAGGRFVLTSDLVVEDANTTGISLQPAAGGPLDVDIDLNGFSIRGPVECEIQQGLVCAPVGSGYGITTGASGAHLTVRNGTIRGMGRHAIGLTFTGSRLHAESVLAIGNAVNGFSLLEGELEDCRAEGNGGNGFAFSLNASAHGRDLVARRNGGDGFVLGGGVRLVDPVAVANFGDGFDESPFNFGGNLVTGCVAKGNDGRGLALGTTDAHGHCTFDGNGIDLPSGVALAPSSCGAALCP